MARRRLRALSLPSLVLAMTVGSLFTVGGSGSGSVSGPGPGSAALASSAASCAPRLLVLSAMPLEMDPILAHAQIDPGSLTTINDRNFVTGTLEGKAVIMGLTGIGPENAQTTTTEAIAHYASCGVSGVVFSGTSGGDDIGNVFVPNQWDYFDGATGTVSSTEQPDSAMLAAAQAAVTDGDVRLQDAAPTGDPACVCTATNGVQTPVTVEHTPTVEFGLTGYTYDPLDGHPLPCFPAGSDVFGCVPCQEMDQSQLAQATAVAEESPAFVDPGFFTSYVQAKSPPGYVQDDETAVVAKVAAQNLLPFIGFRAASDGPGNAPGTGGDRLDLPGYPAQFLVYRQLAADNSAAMTRGFLEVYAA